MYERQVQVDQTSMNFTRRSEVVGVTTEITVTKKKERDTYQEGLDELRRVAPGVDPNSTEGLIIRHMKLVVKLANKYAKCGYQGCDQEELVGVGNLQLVKCAQKYDPSLGVSFITYAQRCIEGVMLNFIQQNATLLSISIRDSRDFNRHLMDQKRAGEEATAFDSFFVVSTDAEDFFDTGREDAALAGVISNDTYEYAIQQAQLVLKPVDYSIVAERLGLHDGVKHTFKEIAKKRGTTDVQVRKSYNRSLQKLQNRKEFQNLHSIGM